MERKEYLKRWFKLREKYGHENVVYFDESGFKANTGRLDGWTKRGQKLYCEVKGRREKRTNLLMALKGKDFLAPLIFKGSCTAKLVEKWAEKFLIKELNRPSLIIMDNAPVHNKKKLRDLLEKHGHFLLPLPKYSPDLNPIEQTFGALKKRRQGMPIDTTIEELILSYS